MLRSMPFKVLELRIMGIYYEFICFTYFTNIFFVLSSKQIGHFTAIIQEKSTHVGCAIVHQTLQNGRNTQLLACNYAYTNIFNKPVYETGRSGSKCSTGTNANYTSLCSVNEKYSLVP